MHFHLPKPLHDWRAASISALISRSASFADAVYRAQS
jgi:hypothetical protein